MFFEEKSILLLSVKFFNYEILIKDELERLGAKVDLYDERPSNSFYSKAILRIKKELYYIKIRKYFKTIISQISTKRYDFFLLIKGEATPVFFLEFLRINNPGIVFIYYTYDSFKNNPNGLSILDYFDRKFTFDKIDAGKYKLSFRPLFYAPKYAEIKEQTDKFVYDLSFVGTAHSDRYILSQKIVNWGSQLGLRFLTFYYSPSKYLFKFRKLTDNSFSHFESDKICFKSMSHQEIINIYSMSKAILDINHPNQNGLTMRTFETLGAGRKLITTNQTIVDYPFYDPQNIFIIDRNQPVLSYDFFEEDFKNINEDLLFSMSLNGWLEELFNNESDIWNTW